MAGWLEFVLLRRALTKRIGSVRIPPSFLARLWTAAILAGAAGAALYHLVIPRIPLPPLIPHVRDAILVCGVFGAVYFAAAMLMRVDEARATLGRFIKSKNTPP